MFSGAQISLYPMADDFVGIILGALGALDPYRDRLRIETDDISTLLVGPPEVLFPAMRDLFVAAAAAASIACCRRPSRAAAPASRTTRSAARPIGGPAGRWTQRKDAAFRAVPGHAATGQPAAAQFSLYVMGTGDHMDEIYGCIDFLKQSGVFDRSKNFCTRLRGDAGAVFATLNEAFCRFGPGAGHVTLDITVSANSPRAV